MARTDLSIRSIERFDGIAQSHLDKGETVEAALPVWLGGTYMPLILSIIGGAMIGSITSSTIGDRSIWLLVAGAVVGAYVGNYLAKRKARDHPVSTTRRQVYLAVTNRRILIYENGSLGKPGGLRSELNRKRLESATIRRGGFIRPARLTLTINGVEYTYDYSGLWSVPKLLEAVGAVA